MPQLVMGFARSLSRLILVWTVAALSGPDAAAQSNTFEDDRFGFRIRAPRAWNPIPIPTGEGWLVAKYVSDKSYRYAVDGWTYEFEPELMVIAFLSEDLLKKARKARERELEEAAERAAEKAREKGGDEPQEQGGDGEGDGEGGGGDGEGGDDGDGDDDEADPEDGPDPEGDGDTPPVADEVLLTFGRRYKDYKDYLSSTYSGGGYYFSAEETGEHDGIPVTMYEVKVEKLARTGPKRIVTWVYHLEDVDVAVQFEVLEDSYGKLKRTVARTLESFKEIPRTAALPEDQQSAGTTVRISFGDLEKLDPDQRKAKRQLQEQQEHEAAIANLTEGWRHERMGSFLVLSHADAKFDKRVVEQAEAVIRFLEDTFDYVGPQEYVRAPILRICKDMDEEWAFRRGGGTWSFNNLEITTHKDVSGFASFEFESINRGLVHHWFYEKDLELWSGMPEWLQYGITNLIAESSEKHGKLDFYRDEWTRDTLRELLQQDRATHVRELMSMTSQEFLSGSGSSGWDRMKEAHALVDYLLLGKGSKGSTKNLVHDYIRTLDEIVEARSKESVFTTAEAPETEEEEVEQLRRRKDAWRKREQELLDAVEQRLFGDWSSKDWDKLDRNYRRSL